MYKSEKDRNSKLRLKDVNDSDDYDDDDDILVTPKVQVSHIEYVNDIYNEKDYDTDLEVNDEEENLAQSEDPKNIYSKMCKNLKVVPCRYFMANIDNQKLVMRYHQFSPEEVRAISKPLWV